MAAAQLPPIHDDPCARFIIAVARQLNLRVVTCDAGFREYGVQVVS